MSICQTHMLTQCSDNIAAFFSAPSILEHLIDDRLLNLDASLTLGCSYLYQGSIDALNCQWLRLSERKSLFLLGFKRNIASISILVIERLESPGI